MKKHVSNANLPDILEKMDAKWAMGCDKCEYGLVSPPTIPPVAASVYMVRLVQATNKDLTFCDCQAGVNYRKYLLHHLGKLRHEAKANVKGEFNMARFAERNTHPDIETIRQAMALVAPTVHGVPEPPRERVPA